MKKNILIIIIIIASIFIYLSTTSKMVVIYHNNTSEKPIDIILNKFQDSDCGMIINDLTYASQVIAPDGRTWFFHDHGNMVHWLKDKPFKKKAIIWVMSKDTKQWINGRKAWYSRNENTPMLYGFGAYEYKKSNLIDFKTMSLYMLRGETMANPLIKKHLLSN